MMRKQFKDIDIYAGIKAQDGAKWIKDNGIVENWKTPEHIEVRPVYTKFIRKKTWRAWSTSTSQPVFPPTSVARTP